MATVIPVNEENFTAEVLNEESPVVVAICRAGKEEGFHHIFSRIASTYSTVKFVMMKVEECAETMKKYRIHEIPMILTFIAGEEMDRTGRPDCAQTVINMLDRHVGETTSFVEWRCMVLTSLQDQENEYVEQVYIESNEQVEKDYEESAYISQGSPRAHTRVVMYPAHDEPKTERRLIIPTSLVDDKITSGSWRVMRDSNGEDMDTRAHRSAREKIAEPRGDRGFDIECSHENQKS